MNSCIYCGLGFQTANGEHVLQNSLGARWTTEIIVCNKCQKDFGDTIDPAVGEGFAWLRNLFDIFTGRGKRASTIKKLLTPGGRVVDLEPGGLPRLNQPHIEVEEASPDKVIGRISAGNEQQLEWGLKLLQDRFPGATLDRDSLIATLKTVSAPLGEEVRVKANIGGIDYSRGILKSCFNLYAVSFPHAAREDCFGPLRDFVLHAEGNVSDFHRWPVVSDSFPRKSGLEHRIAIVRRGRSIEGIVSLFGYIDQVVRLCDNYEGDEPQQCSYRIDPLRERQPAEERNFSFNETDVLQFGEQPPLLGPENTAALAANLQETGAFHFRHRTINKIADELQLIEARYEGLRPLSPEQEEERQREMREAVRRTTEAAVDFAFLSEDSA